MRLISAAITVALLATLSAARAQDIEPLPGGWYQQSFKDSGVTYLVDTHIRLCFVSRGRTAGIAQIPCGRLLRRKEWGPVITWSDAPKERKIN